MLRIGATCFANRACSQQEQLYLTSGLPLRASSRQVERLCVAYPEHRPGLLNTAAMQAATTAAFPDEDSASDAEDNDEESRTRRAAVLQLNKIDFYRHRPEEPEMENCTLAQFVR